MGQDISEWDKSTQNEASWVRMRQVDLERDELPENETSIFRMKQVNSQ